MNRATLLLLASCTASLIPASAQALPAFARKYSTSCQTCHTIFPKLTPFGEAFRRNGYRFPGTDSDFIQQPTVALGQEQAKKDFPHSIWPATLPGSLPLAAGFNGTAMVHPAKNAAATAADNGAAFSLHDLAAEGHLWAGGTFDDKISYYAEFTISSEGGAEIESAKVLFNDLLGPKHLINVVVGRSQWGLTSFGPKSSYLADGLIVATPVTALLGATTDSFNVVDPANGVEVEGTIAGRFDYSVGLNAGTNLDLRPTENTYAHVGAKLGGMRLDGENAGAPPDPSRPWAENALTFDAFAYHSNSRFTAADSNNLQDAAWTMGASVRAQWMSLELDSGAYYEQHSHAQVGAAGATAVVQYNELSYIVFPWLVPAVRVEWLRIAAAGLSPVYDLRIIPGIAFAIRPNLKATLTAQIENANGAPAAGWGAAGGFAAPTTNTVTEIETVTAGLTAAF